MRWRSWVIITPPKRDDPIYASEGFTVLLPQSGFVQQAISLNENLAKLILVQRGFDVLIAGPAIPGSDLHELYEAEHSDRIVGNKLFVARRCHPRLTFGLVWTVTLNPCSLRASNAGTMVFPAAAIFWFATGTSSARE